jgi:5-methylcytosine-specific restriction enzyme A
MPFRALSLCAAPGCAVGLPKPGRCPAHKRPAWQRSSPGPSPYNYAHQKLRAEVLAAEPVCYLCHNARATTLDHVIPLAEGGTSDRSNARGACKNCQQSKASREGARARARIRAGRNT